MLYMYVCVFVCVCVCVCVGGTVIYNIVIKYCISIQTNITYVMYKKFYLFSNEVLKSQS